MPTSIALPGSSTPANSSLLIGRPEFFARDINRFKWNLGKLTKKLNDEKSIENIVYKKLLDMILLRK